MTIEQPEIPAMALLQATKRYVLTHMVWYEDSTEPKLTGIGKLIVNLIDAEIERQSAPVKDILDDLNELSKDGDWEKAHIKADVLLCELLLYLGHEEVVDAWERVGKWYA